MYRDNREKLAVCHGYDLGELYDLKADTGEHVNLWNGSASVELKMDLLKSSFDSTVMITDWGGFPSLTRTNLGF